MVRRDILVGNDMECASSLDLFFGGVQWIMANALVEAAKLVQVGGVPDVGCMNTSITIRDDGWAPFCHDRVEGAPGLPAKRVTQTVFRHHSHTLA